MPVTDSTPSQNLPARFKLDFELGRGGMGVVYKAFDSAFGRDVAIKVLAEGLADAELVHRFRRESAEHSELSHPNVVRCHEFGTHGSVDYLVMEYVDGGCLRDFVDRCGGYQDIVRAYREICLGLEHIHTQGIVHRDVKPRNILFTMEGEPKISDFGIARRISGTSELTQTGIIMGTSAYLAPEQILSSKTVTPSADLYALGVCLFESLTGRLPFSKETDYLLLRAHISEEPPAPSSLKPELPHALDKIVLSLLGKNPSQRPPSALAAANMLEALLDADLRAGTSTKTQPFNPDDKLEGFVGVGPDGRIESCNTEAALLLGHTPDELFGQPIERWLPQMRDLMEGVAPPPGEVIRMDAARRVEKTCPLDVVLTATATTRGRSWNAVLRAVKGAPDGLSTELAGQGHMDVLSRLGHDIWTPMNGILGMTRLTLGTDLQPEQRNFLQAVETSAERLVEVLNTAFDFSRLRAGTLTLEPVLIDLRQFLSAVLRPFMLQATSRNIELTLHVDPLVPDLVLADPARLRQILGHLLANAFKFTERGGISMAVTRQSGDDRVVTLRFSISDTGCGLKAGTEKMIFRPFYQEDATVFRTTGGVGLGLAIVEGLVRMMDGTVWADSVSGRGSIFHCELPLGVGGSNETGYRARLHELKALVVLGGGEEETLLSLLRRWGLEVSTTANFDTAGAIIDSARSANRPFEVVVAPLKDGDAYAFVRENKTAREAFVLVTDRVGPGDAALCHKLGVNALLIRPVNANDLWDNLIKILQDGPRNHGAGLGPLSILVAEDNPINQTLATVMLETRGHTVTIAENGLKVLERLGKGELYDLILMDLQMPHLDGLATTERIRESERGTSRHIPIVALTAHGDPAACLAAGMDAFLKRPLDEDKLLDAIARLIDRDATIATSKKALGLTDEDEAPLRESQPPSKPSNGHTPAEASATGSPGPAQSAVSAAATPPAPAPVAPPEPSSSQVVDGAPAPAPLPSPPAAEKTANGAPPSATPAAPPEARTQPGAGPNETTLKTIVVDEPALIARLGGNMKNLRQLIDLFFSLSPMQLQAVHKALQSGDPDAVQRASHTIKGSLAGFSALSAADAAEALEKLGQSGDLSNAETAYQRLDAEVERVTTVLQDLKKRTADQV